MGETAVNDPLLEVFIYETSQNMEQLEQIVIRTEKQQCYTPEDINEIFRIMHTVKGSAAMMLYESVSSLAHRIEDLFYFIRENDPDDYDCTGISDIILSSIDFISGELETIKQGKFPEGKPDQLITRANDILEDLKKRNDDGKKQPDQPNPVKQDADFSIVGDGACFQAVFYFEEGCEMENIRAFNLMYQLGEFADVICCIPGDIAENDDSVDEIRKNGFRLYFQSSREPAEIGRFFDNAVFKKSCELTLIENEAELNRLVKASCASDEKAGVKQSEETKTKETQEKPRDQAPILAQNVISVNISKLDKLMDMIGELVIAESMVSHNPELKDLPLDSFHKAVRQMNKITNELQDLAMSVRMVPINNVFQKMNRIVRDMSKKLGKEVELEIVGGDTEVDKNIIDHISDPLMHLLRNAIDHGLESAEDRINAGKPPIGSVSLEAKNEGGEIQVIVRDDGKGLNKEKILNRAKKNGLLTKPESEMTEKEIYSLIFIPGFSTSEHVTEFSGRGVGMDVVVKNIEQVGGRISVESAENKGTKITIRFPLTLAIIDGMNVRVGGSSYTLPITSIRQSLRPLAKDVIKDPNGNEMVLLREKSCPIIRLHRFYGIPSDTEVISEGILVLTENSDQTFCLFADELLGQHQVVVKPLPKYLSSIKGIAGCAQLGDGSISLILDMGSLIESLKQR